MLDSLVSTLVGDSGEQPISRLLGLTTGQVQFRKIAHVKDDRICAARECLLSNL